MCFGQNLQGEFKNMYSYLESLKTYRLNVDYNTTDTSDMSDEGVVSVLITPEGYFYQTDFCEILINPTHTLLINELERTVIYSLNHKLDRKEKAFDVSMLINGLDSLVQHADSVYFSYNGLERVYYLRMKNAYFNLIELHFSGSLLASVQYFYNPDYTEGQILSASNIITIEEHPEFSSEAFNTSFYFTEKNGVITPTEEFSNYRFIYNESVEELMK
jgi:hypothetical protein